MQEVVEPIEREVELQQRSPPAEVTRVDKHVTGGDFQASVEEVGVRDGDDAHSWEDSLLEGTWSRRATVVGRHERQP
jgi:hypothetical protein